MRKRLLSVLLVVVSTSLSTAPFGAAQAQAPAPTSRPPNRLSFSATLDSIKVNIRASEVVTRQFRLTLDPNQPRTRFRASVEDFWRSEDGTQSHYAPAGTLARSCAKWVSVNPVESVVGAEETLVVRLTINTPSEVRDGGYWCVLKVDEVPDPEDNAARVGVKFLASVSTGVFLFAGTVQRDASIVDLKVNAEQAFVTVRNDGNAPIGVEGRLEFVSDDAQKSVPSAVLARTTVLTEPVTQSVLAAALPPPAELPSGRYRVRAILDFGGEHLIGAEREIEIIRAGRPNVARR